MRLSCRSRPLRHVRHVRLPRFPLQLEREIMLQTALRVSHESAYFPLPVLLAPVASPVKARTVSPAISSAAGFPP